MTNTQYEPDYIVRNNPSQSQSKSPPWALRSNPLLGSPFGHLCLVLMLHSCGKLSLSESQRLRLQSLAKNLNLPNYILKYYCSAPENSLAGKVRIWQFFFPHLDIFLAFFSSSGARNCFQIILSAAETWCRWVSSSNSTSFPVRSRHLRAICGQGEWKLNTDYYCLFLHALQVHRSPDYSNKSRARGNHTVTARTTAGVYVRAEPALMKARAHG